MAERRDARTVLLGKSEGKIPFGKVDGRIILKWVSSKWVGVWTGLIRLRIWTGGGLFECDNEPSIFIKCAEFLDKLGDS